MSLYISLTFYFRLIFFSKSRIGCGLILIDISEGPNVQNACHNELIKLSYYFLNKMIRFISLLQSQKSPFNIKEYYKYK